VATGANNVGDERLRSDIADSLEEPTGSHALVIVAGQERSGEHEHRRGAWSL
jgi:hypothetical protein